MSDQIPLIDMKPNYEAVGAELEAAVLEVMRSGRYILGPKVEELEQAVAAYCGAPSAVGLASGTDALIIAVRALELEPGSKIVTTPFSFIATSECIDANRGAPVFCDIEQTTYNLDPRKVAERIESDPAGIKALIPVHIYGQAADMEAFSDLAAERGLALIEDAAQAFGARCTVHGHEKPVCGIGVLSCLSFFPTKNLSTCGDGGMVVSLDPELDKRIRILRAHGASPKYHHAMLGYNSRLDPLHAAVVSAKLAHVDRWLKMRRERAGKYKSLFREALAGDDIQVADSGSVDILGLGDADRFVILPTEAPGRRHTYNSFNILIPRRNELQAFLAENRVASMIYYPIPLHLQKVYAPLGYKRGHMPVTEWVCDHVLALPFYPEIPDAHLDRVAALVREFVLR